MKSLLLLFAAAVFSFPSDGFAQVKWMTWDEAVAATETEPRKIFVDVYTDWCGWCKRMDANTFSDPAVAKLLNQEYYPVKFDAEQRESITFKGKEYAFVGSGRRGYHELAKFLLNGRMGYPTVVFLDDGADVIQPVPGYHEAAEFAKIAGYFASDAYKAMPFEDYAGR